MNRKEIILKTHQFSSSLNIKNPLFKRDLRRFGIDSIKSDLFPNGDITSDAIFNNSDKASAYIISKENGIIAGISEVYEIIKDFNKFFKKNIKIEKLVKDGSWVKKGQKIIKLSGEIKSLLSVERTILNILQRMSGIATFTDKLKSKIRKDVLLCSTRKTICGLLDKKAVVIGGGGTHRINLSDAVLIKDNHLKISNFEFRITKKKYFEILLKKILKKSKKYRFIEIEVENTKEAIIAGEIFKKHKITGYILLDNFSPKDIIKTISLLKKKQLYDCVILEASGNISEKNIEKYAKTGIDIISMGALTHSVKALDMSMRIGAEERI